MLFSRKRVRLIILVGGLLFSLGNLWITFSRSLIPREINGTIAKKELGREKHPGKDDIHWILLEDGRKLQVDGEVWNKVEEKDLLRKDSWSQALSVQEDGGREVDIRLSPSKDFLGMGWVMSVAILVVVGLTVISQRRSER